MSASETLQRVQQLMQMGRWNEARAELARLAARPGCPVSALHQLAELEILAGDARQALARLAALGPRADDDTQLLIARAEAANGDPRAALERMRALRSRVPPSAVLELHAGYAAHQAGDDDEAEAAWREALRLAPSLQAARHALASLLVNHGRFAEAGQWVDASAEASSPNAWILRARIETGSGEGAAAVRSLDRAVSLQPADAGTWRAIGLLYAEHARHVKAENALERARALGDTSAGVESMLANVKQELGDDAGALACYQRAAQADPLDLQVALGGALYLPQVYESEADAARWRDRYSNGLDTLLRRVSAFRPRAGQIFDLDRGNFLLAYQGEDDLPLQKKFASLVGELLDSAAPQWRSPRPVRFDSGRRLRVGFLASTFRDCTAGRYFERWITGLDANRFERFVYHTAPVSDAFTQWIAASVEHFVPLRVGAREAAARVASDDLDVLVYPEVGMDALTYVLAALRLAPVQCAGWGHPVTTGSDRIDYFFTSAAMEPPQAQAHYSERLVMLPGIGVDYERPPVPQPRARSDFKLPEHGAIYACPQSLFKIHPEMDDLFARILAADPDGAIVFFQATSDAVTRKFGARLQQALARHGVPPRGQLKFLPRMDATRFREVLGLADVVLDTVRWSGGNTSLDAFAAGAPVLTMAGRFMRARQTFGMLQLMGLPELVADSRDAYVSKAAALAHDTAAAQGLREAIRERNARLFGDRSAFEAFQDALEAAARNA